ncbi:MAG: tail fiber domain-containing protein, partial [archaeon]
FDAISNSTINISIDYSEPAFTLNPITKEYTNVMTLLVASPSGNTIWTSPAVMNQTSFPYTTKSLSYENGLLQFIDGNEGVGKVLTSDASGYATWQDVGSLGAGWSLTGNSDTIDGLNFIGTTDKTPLNFKINNERAGRIDFLDNTFFGHYAGNNYGGNIGGINIELNKSGSGYHSDTTTITIDPPPAGGTPATATLDISPNVAVNEIQTITPDGSSIPDGGNYRLFFNGETTTLLNYDADASTIQSALEALFTIGTGNVSVTGNITTWINVEFIGALAHEGAPSTISVDSVNLTSGGGHLFMNPYVNTTQYASIGGQITKIIMTDPGSGYDSIPSVTISDPNQDLDGAPVKFTVTLLESTGIGGGNTAFGKNSLYSNTMGKNSVAMGNDALYSNTGGAGNVAIGSSALYSNTKANFNTAIGDNALYSNVSGEQNTALGYRSLYSNKSGLNNTAIGAGADVSFDGLTNATAIGHNAKVGASNSLVLGGTGVDAVNVGIGMTTPTARLDLPAGTTVAGTVPLKFTSGTNLTAPEAGAMEWDGTNLFITQTSGPTRKTIAYTSDIATPAITVVNTSNLYSTAFAGTGGGTGVTYSNFLGDGAGNNAMNVSNSNFFGASAGASTIFVNGSSNSNFFGYVAGYIATGASDSNFFGNMSGYEAGGAASSNFFGPGSGYLAFNATYSNFFGAQAGSQSNGAYSNFLGVDSGAHATSASNSNFLGAYAGYYAATASNSIFIGQNAGDHDVVDNTSNSDDFSILIGKSTGTGGFKNSIAIGGSATNTAVNQLMIGSTTRPINTTVWKMTTGDATLNSTGIITTSDERLKQNIIDLPNDTLSKLINVKTVNFNWLKGDTDKLNIGFIAQDLEQYFPELVYEGADGYKGVNYANMTPVIVEAVRELNLKIEDLVNIDTPLVDENNQETFVGKFFDRMIAWFGNAENGIQSLFVKEVHTEKICVKKSDGTEFCANGDELENMVNENSNTITSGGSSSESGGATPPADPTCSDRIQNQDETGVDTGGVC